MPRKKAAPRPEVTCPSCGRVADPAAGALNFCPGCGVDLRGGAAPAPSGASSLLGKVVGDRYRLLSVVGEGGMGSVFKAEHIRMGKALALKILRGDFAHEEGAVERFLAEAQIVSRLSHPHTIAVFDFGEIEDGSGFYLAMEYVPGRDLAAVLRDEGRLSEARAAAIGVQILGSLAEAHDAGIVHRDMKPGNVMLMQTRAGEDFAKVLDFGIAKLRDDAGVAAAATTSARAAAAATTSAGAIVGTPYYVAPEQVRGERIDGRADLYAVGCLLYELAAGHPPFQAPSPMAVVAAHLHQPPPPLTEEAKGISGRFAEVVHRALAKAPAARFASADEMREALLAAVEPTGTWRLRRPTSPAVTGELAIASREDFRDFDRQVRALRRSRVLAPLTALALLAAVGGAVWRWAEVYAFVSARAPALAAALPAALRPGTVFDGAEREPNDVPARANPLPIPPGADGRPGGGVAIVRGHVGAKLSETSGDVDLFRLEVPPAPGRRVLVAEWRGEREGEGIRGLDVALALNRGPRSGDERTSAPLVAAADRAATGRPERLVAAVEAGTYYLAVREQHDAASGPVEKPTDGYVVSVRLEEPEPGEEVEPNDAPDLAGARFERYPAWRALAGRNPLADGAPLHGEGAEGDADVYALEGAQEGAARLVAALPAAGLALSARLWLPDAEDLVDPARPEDRVRFGPATEAGAGAPLLLPLAASARPDAPALLEVRASAGEGRYDLVLLGEGPRAGDVTLGLVSSLAEAGRAEAALSLAAGYATLLPRAARRAEVLLLAGRLAEKLAPGLDPAAARAHDRAAQLLGGAIFEEAGGAVAYRGAFEAAAAGAGRAADEAALRLLSLASPCAPRELALRAGAFLERRPAPDPDLAGEARALRARALEEVFWAAGGKDPAALAAALAAWRAASAGGAPAGEEAAARAAALGAKVPSKEGARPACR